MSIRLVNPNRFDFGLPEDSKRVDEALYLKFLAQLPLACVDVVIVRDGCALLVCRASAPAKGQWWLPGGRVLKGETLKQAAWRKAKEEVSLDCWVGPVLHTAETLFPDGPNGVPVHSVNTCFLLIPKRASAVYLNDTVTAFQWYNPLECVEVLHPYVRDCLVKAGFECVSQASPSSETV